MWNLFKKKRPIQEKLYSAYIEITTRCALQENRQLDTKRGSFFVRFDNSNINFLDFHSNLFTLVERLRSVCGDICAADSYQSSIEAKLLVKEILFFISLIKEYLSCWAVSYTTWLAWAKLNHGDVRLVLPKTAPFKQSLLQSFFIDANPGIELETYNLLMIGTQLSILINSFDNANEFKKELETFQNSIPSLLPNRAVALAE